MFLPTQDSKNINFPSKIKTEPNYTSLMYDRNKS